MNEPLLRSTLDMWRGVALANPLSRHSEIMLMMLDEIDRVQAQNAELRAELAKLKAAPVKPLKAKPKDTYAILERRRSGGAR